MNNKFLLLLGPSGVGKSTIMHELRESDDRFVYISPYITRPLRDGEKDKVSISNEQMNEMASRGEFLVINEIYGIRYATPKQPILDALDSGKFPLLDWPVHKIDVMEKAFGDRLHRVYVYPESLEELKERIDKDGRDVDGSRYARAVEELEKFHSGVYEGSYNFSVASKKDMVPELARQIYSSYLEAIGGEGRPKSKEQL